MCDRLNFEVGKFALHKARLLPVPMQLQSGRSNATVPDIVSLLKTVMYIW